MNARANDPMTAQDGVALLTELQDLKRVWQETSNRLATIQRNEVIILEVLGQIEAGLSQNRVGRLELELRETELEKDIAERRFKALEEKLDLKKNANNAAVDTNEKIRQASASAAADLEKQKREAMLSYWEDIKRGAVKQIINTLAVGGALGALAFIWWLFQLYLNR